MKNKYILNLLVLCFLFLPVYVHSEKVGSDIENIFRNYKRSLESKNGIQASSLVSRQTLAYYEELRKISLEATETQTRRLPISKKLTVLMFRLRIDKIDLKRMDGKKLFAYSVNKGWVSQESIKNVELGEITVNGDVAHAIIVSRGKQNKNVKFQFYKQDGIWKLDLNDMMSGMDKGLQKLAEVKKVSEDQLVQFFVEKATGMKVTPAIWAGPRN